MKLWVPLHEIKEPNVWRGAVFRFPAKYPFERLVDFMLMIDRGLDAEFRLICSSGYHAGEIELVLPEETKHKDGGISVQWVQENWQKWIYPDCTPEEVKYTENHTAYDAEEPASK